MADKIRPDRSGSIRFLFFIAGLYDIALGGALLYMAPAVFAFVNVPLPPQIAYVHFPAALLVLFGLMCWHVMIRPDLGRVLIPYPVLFKLAYCTVAGWSWVTGSLSWVWLVPGLAALAFLVLFVWAFFASPKEDEF